MRPVSSVLAVIFVACYASACSKTSENDVRDGGTDAATDADREAGLTCEYIGRTHTAGEEFCGIDGCNSCGCQVTTSGGILCSQIGCAPQRDVQDFCARELWHLPGSDRSTTLAIFADGSFRWISVGCDSVEQDVGVWRDPGESLYLELLPAPGRTEFAWPTGATYGTLTIQDAPESLGGSLVIQLSETETQSWEHGGMCPICGADAGATSEESCLNPFAYCNLHTKTCSPPSPRRGH